MAFVDPKTYVGRACDELRIRQFALDLPQTIKVAGRRKPALWSLHIKITGVVLPVIEYLLGARAQ